MTYPPSTKPYWNPACSPLPELKPWVCLPRLFPSALPSCPAQITSVDFSHPGLWVSVYTCRQASLLVPFLCGSLHTRIYFPSLRPSLPALTWLLSGTALPACGLAYHWSFSDPVISAISPVCPCCTWVPWPPSSAFGFLPHVWSSLSGEGSTLATRPRDRLTAGLPAFGL